MKLENLLSEIRKIKGRYRDDTLNVPASNG